MSPLFLQNGQLLLANGSLAIGSGCCCNVPPPSGACCTGSGCEILTQAECLGISGAWQGAGTDCEPTGPEGINICQGLCCSDIYDPELGGALPTCTDYVYEADCAGGTNVFFQGHVCSEGYSNPYGTFCVGTAAPCVSDSDCDPCSCCQGGAPEFLIPGECVPAEACPEPTIDSATWCGQNILIGAGGEADIGCNGNLVCEDPEQTTSYSTKAYWSQVSLIESVECGAEQTTNLPGGNPLRDPRSCRYIYSVEVGYGHGANLADNPCYKRYLYGYLDTDPCSPVGGNLIMISDPAQEVNGAIADPCTIPPGQNVPGCAPDCVNLCGDGPVIFISFPP